MRLLFIIFAVVLFVVAFNFGKVQPPFFQATGINSVAITANMVAALAALGFALAGGLSLIAAAIVKGRSEIANKP